MVLPAEKKSLTWADMWDCKRRMDEWRATGRGPIKVTDAYLKRNFVYQVRLVATANSVRG